MSFNCKRSDGENQNISWEYIQKGWLPAITVCSQSLYAYEPNISVDDVQGFTIEASGVFIKFKWKKNLKYSDVYGEIKIGDNNWVNWVPDENGGTVVTNSEAENFVSFYMPLTYYGVAFASGDTITARMRFGKDNLVSLNDAQSVSNLEKYLIFSGEESIDETHFLDNASLDNEPTIEKIGNNIYIDRPDYITSLSFDNSFNYQGTLHLGQLFNCGDFYTFSNNIKHIDVLNIVPQENVEYEHTLDSIYLQDCGYVESFITSNLPNINYIGFYDCLAFSNISTPNLSGNGGKSYIGLYMCNISETTLNAFFDEIADAYDQNKSYIDIGANPGSATANLGVAVEKGWTVYGGRALLFISTDPDLTGTNLSNTFEGHYVSSDPIVLSAHSQYLYVDHMEYIQNLDISNLGLIGKLRIYAYSLTELNITNNDLEYVYIPYSGLSVLDVGGNPNLKKVTLDGTVNANIANLNDASLLEYLYAPNNALDSSIDLTNFPMLTFFYATNSNMDVMDFSNCILIQYINASNSSYLTSIDLSNCIYLKYLILNHTSMTTLDVNDCMSLSELHLDYTQLNGLLSISDLSYLNFISLAYSHLFSFNFDNLPSLTNLYANNMSSMTSATITNMDTITNIEIYQNSLLTALTLSNCSNLNYVNANNNNMNATALNNILTALPDRTDLDQGTALFVSNPGAGTCNTSIGSNKNWFVGVT